MRTAAPCSTPTDERIDRLINLDFGSRGNEQLYDATRAKFDAPLARNAARLLAEVPRESTVLMTTGSLSRAWVSPNICENDGPAGAAAVARALAVGLGAIPILLAEATVLASIGAVFRAAGLSLVSLAEARKLQAQGGPLAVTVLEPYPIDDEGGRAEAAPLLDRLQPALLFSTERAARNEKNVYHSATGRDFGMGRARVDYVFDEALRRQIPSIGIGDGCNEIGMGLIGDAVAANIPYGERCRCGCGGGVGAITKTTTLVTAGCSNWGCYGVLASLAAILRDDRVLHTPETEHRLLEAGVSGGLIDSTSGVVTTSVDGISAASHVAMAELLHELGKRGIKSQAACA
jgi:hypothetical protein